MPARDFSFSQYQARDTALAGILVCEITSIHSLPHVAANNALVAIEIVGDLPLTYALLEAKRGRPDTIGLIEKRFDCFDHFSYPFRDSHL